MLVKCVICGKEFEKEKGRGKAYKYCSDECRKVARSRANTEKMVERYHGDAEWRAKRVKQNVASNRKRREARKEQAMQELCKELYDAKSSGDIRAILEKKVRIKASIYNAKSV
jgi:endogenous inhibitor of DNA gyrase (YacG/DUF329 family)